MRVAVSGASGLIGSALVPALAGAGDLVTRLVRSPRQTGEDTLLWDPDAGTLDRARLEGIDAVVNLAGETVAGRWSEAKKTRIMESRRRSTRLLAETVAALERRPQAFVCASAVGYYGNRGDERLTEESPAGEGFLVEVVREWEAAARPAAEAGTRVVNLRFGIVLSPNGGALRQMLLPFRLGLGGPLGSGRQYMSWIAIDDVVGVARHALGTTGLSGPVNATAPEPVRRFCPCPRSPCGSCSASSPTRDCCGASAPCPRSLPPAATRSASPSSSARSGTYSENEGRIHSGLQANGFERFVSGLVLASARYPAAPDRADDVVAPVYQRAAPPRAPRVANEHGTPLPSLEDDLFDFSAELVERLDPVLVVPAQGLRTSDDANVVRRALYRAPVDVGMPELSRCVQAAMLQRLELPAHDFGVLP